MTIITRALTFLRGLVQRDAVADGVSELVRMVLLSARLL